MIKNVGFLLVLYLYLHNGYLEAVEGEGGDILDFYVCCVNVGTMIRC